jgi:hypothetical protein
MHAWWLGAAAVLLATGCSVVEPGDFLEAPDWQREDVRQESAQSTLSLRTNTGTAIVLSVGGADVVGADVNLERFDEPPGVAIRGRAFGQPVNLDAEGERVSGVFGGRPFDLTATRRGDALTIRGTVLGGPARLRIDDLAIEGRLGRCSYTLDRAEALAYEGQRSCGASIERVRLWMPTALGFWGDAQRAAVLAILLGQ